MIEDMQIRNLTPNTQHVYVAQVVRFACHFGKYVAQRLVQLDWMTGGRAIFGSGPGALASDAHTLGIDPMVQRDRQDEAIGIIRRLFNGERVTAKSDWFTAPGRGAATFALTGGHVFRDRLSDQPIRHDIGRQARDRHHLDRVDVERRPQCSSDAMGLRRGRRQEARQDGRPQELARPVELAHRRDS
jgi:hypothetical protein